MQVLLIEDDTFLRTTLARTLSRQGIQVHQCADGVQAVEQWLNLRPDVVVLDLTLPGQDGLEVLSQARAKGLQTPVIITTARGTVGDKILGLNVGADDYISKPFDLDELEARIRALVRRASQLGGGRSGIGAPSSQLVGSLAFDEQSGMAQVSGRPLELSPRESAMVRALMHRPGQAMSKERLFDAVFEGDSDVALDAVEVVAYRLRKKLRDAGCHTQLVTLRGLGYLLQDHVSAN